jgi:hypothetical protein
MFSIKDSFRICGFWGTIEKLFLHLIMSFWSSFFLSIRNVPDLG